MSKLALITAAVLLVPAPALAQIVFDDGQPAAAPAKGAKAKSDVNKLVCRTQDTIGTRLQNHQVCMTLEQWHAYEQANKDELATLQAKSTLPAAH